MGSKDARAMTTAVDTNVFIALWYKDDALNTLARSAMDAAMVRGNLVVSGPVFAELVASPRRTEAFIDYFLKEAGVAVDWNIDEQMWRTAGRAFQSYASRRKRQGDPGPRRILADFLIGAHALRRGYRLLTLDEGLYRSAFPRLAIVTI
jgi:predicted nucleic acid-binding protein